ncbi:MAG: hypothetical protein LBF77_05310 [Spirochaetaceae bacterium]|jgi:hypothetical protein|nr:hypothetical protein [Spirochaetaceae bacterium]
MSCNCIEKLQQQLRKQTDDPEARVLSTIGISENDIEAYIPIPVVYREKKKGRQNVSLWMISQKELARIHAMKKEAAITDGDYRMLLSGAAGVDSSRDIKTQAQYSRVIKALSNLLAAQGKHPCGKFLPQKAFFEKAVCVKAKRILGSNWYGRLTGYLKRLKKTTLADCNEWELRQIMGFLSRVEKSGYGYGKG